MTKMSGQRLTTEGKQCSRKGETKREHTKEADSQVGVDGSDGNSHLLPYKSQKLNSTPFRCLSTFINAQYICTKICCTFKWQNSLLLFIFTQKGTGAQVAIRASRASGKMAMSSWHFVALSSRKDQVLARKRFCLQNHDKIHVFYCLCLFHSVFLFHFRIPK